MAKPNYLNDNAANLVRLIKDGAIFLRALGATNIPSGTNWSPGPESLLLGYYSEDGYTLTPVPGDTTDFLAHNGDVTMSETAPGWWTYGFSALEGNEQVNAAYFDIDPSEIGPDGGFKIRRASNNKEYELVVVGLDQKERLILGYCPRVKISEKEAMTFNRTTLLAAGMTFRTFPDGPVGEEKFHIAAWGFIVDSASDPTGVTAGTPGAFTPSGSTVPANITALRALGSLGQTTAWTTGQYVVIGSGNVHWDGSDWKTGTAA